MSFETRDGMRGADGGTASFLRIEKALLGELDAVEKARFEADLETDPVLRARYHEARARTSPLSWEKVRAALPDPSGIAPRPEARRAPARAGRGERALAWLDRVLPRFPRPALALGGCLLLLLALLPFTGRDAGFRAKGGAKPQLILWPETSVPFLFTERPDALVAIGDMLGDGQMLLAGAVRQEAGADTSADDRYYNSVVAINDKGEILNDGTRKFLQTFVDRYVAWVKRQAAS